MNRGESGHKGPHKELRGRHKEGTEDLTVVILRAFSFNLVKWEAVRGYSKHSETLALLTSPLLYEMGNITAVFVL